MASDLYHEYLIVTCIFISCSKMDYQNANHTHSYMTALTQGHMFGQTRYANAMQINLYHFRKNKR